MNKIKFDNQRFESIQLCRAIAAFFVYISHFYWIGLKITIGTFLMLFFCISGFIMMYSTNKNNKYYFSKRLIKILPLYWLITVGTFLIALIVPSFLPQAPSVIELIKSLLFIPYSREAIHSAEVIRPIVGLGWTLNIEMFFYVIFGLCLLISKKYRGIICSIIFILFYIIHEIFDLTFCIPLYFWTNGYLLAFVSGIILYYILQRLYSLKEYNWLEILLVVLLIVLIPIMLFSNSIPLSWPYNHVILSTLFLFVVIILFRTIKLPKFIVRFGDISFSFYLIHYFVILFMDRYFCDTDAYSVKMMVALVIGFIISVILSNISYELIEKRLSKFLKTKLINSEKTI